MEYCRVLFLAEFYLSYFLYAKGLKFPLKEIFNISEGVKIAEENYLCSIKSILNRNKCCECTKYCMKYKTCCIDRLWNAEKPIPTPEYLNLLINVTNQYKDTTCEPVFPNIGKNVQNHESEDILMISACPKEASHINKKGCKESFGSSYESIIPVFGSDQYIYKNSFCARCNFIKQFELVNMTANCKTRQEQNENPYKSFRSCTFELTRTIAIANYIKTCKKNIFDRTKTCDKANKYFQLCSSYLGVVGSNANYHCLKCSTNGIHKSAERLPNFICSTFNNGITILEKQITVITAVKPALWSFTISFAERTSIALTGLEKSSQKFCDSGEVYNIINSKCEKFTCSEGYKKSINSCIKDNNVFQSPHTIQILRNPSFDRCLVQTNIWMAAKVQDAKTDKATLQEVLEVFLNMALSGSLKSIKVNEGNIYYQTSLNISEEKLYDIQAETSNLESPIWKVVAKFYFTSLPFNTIGNLSETSFTKHFKGGRLCAEKEIIAKNPNNFTSECNAFSFNRTLNYSYSNFLIEANRTSWKRTLISCPAFHLHSSCPLQHVTNYTLLENKTLKIGNSFYNVSQYVPLNGSIGICIPTQNNREYFVTYYKWYENLSKALEYITIFGAIISIVCYFFIMNIYLFVKELKSPTSIIIVFQCTTLFFTDTIFIIAVYMYNNDFGCKLTGVMLHWGLLSAQLWTAIIAFDQLSRIGLVSSTIVHTNFVRLTKYCTIAYITPTIIVVITVLLDIYHVLNIAYGKYNVCFIYGLHSKIYFYIIPFATIFLITLSFLIYTMYFLWKSEKEARKVLRESGRHNIDLLSIAFKLILTFGIIEIVGFIQIAKQDLTENELTFNSVFAVLYTILRSLRGLWLFLIYLCSGRKARLLRSRWKNNIKRLHETISIQMS